MCCWLYYSRRNSTIYITSHTIYYCIGGFIEIATDIDRLEEYRRIAAFNRKCGVNVLEISPKEVQSLFPLCAIDDVLAGMWR